MEEEESGVDVTDEREVLKQQFLAYAHSLGRANVPLGEKIQNVHRLATLLEREEAEYRKQAPNLLVDDREGHSIGDLLALFAENDALRIELLNILLHTTEHELLAGVCRFALSTFVGNSPSITSTEDEDVDMMNKLIEWVSKDGVLPSLRAFATGLLAKHVEGTFLAETLAKSDIPSVLVKRLVGFMQEDFKRGIRTPTKEEAPGEKGLAVKVASVSPEADAQFPPVDALQLSLNSMRYRELVYVIGCLAAVGEHVETLAPILQLGGVDAIFYYSKSNEIIVMYGIQAMLSKLLQHQKFASVFVDKGGIDHLVAFPRSIDRAIPPAPIVAVSLLHLVSFPNVVEQICLLEDSSKSGFVSLTLWLLQHPDEGARKNMALFWTFAFGYKVLMDIFDAADGCKILLTELKKVIAPPPPPAEGQEPEPPKPLPRMLVHHFCMALRDYFRFQLVHYALPTLRRSLPSDRPPTPRYRFLTISDDMIVEATENMMGSEIKIPSWATFVKEEGVETMLLLIERARSLSSVTMDTTRMCLDVLSLVTVDKQTHSTMLGIKVQPLPSEEQTLLDGIIPVPPQQPKAAFTIIMEVLKHPNVELPQSALAALRLLLNYVYYEPSSSAAAHNTAAATSNAVATPSSARRPPGRRHAHAAGADAEIVGAGQANVQRKELPETFRSAVRSIRTQNGISLLVSLLKLGWVTPPPAVSPAGSDALDVRTSLIEVMLGLSKVPDICQVLRKKVSRSLPDLLREQQFTSAAAPTGAQAAYAKLKRETLRLIGVLKGEDAVRLAELESGGTSRHALSPLDRAAIVSATPINYQSTELLELIAKHLQAKGLNKTAQMLVEEASLPKELVEVHAPAVTHPEFASPAPAGPKRKRAINPVASTPQGKFEQEEHPVEPKKEEVTLDGIVRQFLFDQHRHCSTPYSLVPEFNLKNKHVCPEPSLNDRAALAPGNVTRRLFGRELGARYNLNNTGSAWRRFKYSRVRPLRPQYGLEDTQLASVEFLSPEQIILASELGDVFVFDLTKSETTDPVEYQCYEEAEDCRLSVDKRTRQRLLTYTWNVGETKLWDLSKMGAPQHTLPTLCAVFNNGADQILGTLEQGKVGLFDSLTCAEVVQLYDPDAPTNDADRVVVPTSSPDDALIMCDAALWDARSGKLIHKFDMFTDSAFEAFNPSGNEAIINSEVWDLRTFKLLKTVPALDQTFFTFNTAGDVIFAGLHKKATKGSQHTSSLRILDAVSYETLTEQPLDFTLVDFAVNPDDTSLAVIEKVWQRNSYSRIWELGRTRSFDDDEDDIDEDADSEDEESLEDFDDVLEHDEEDEEDDDDMMDVEDVVEGGPFPEGEEEDDENGELEEFDEEDDEDDDLDSDDLAALGSSDEAELMALLGSGDGDDDDDDDGADMDSDD